MEIGVQKKFSVPRLMNANSSQAVSFSFNVISSVLCGSLFGGDTEYLHHRDESWKETDVEIKNYFNLELEG